MENYIGLWQEVTDGDACKKFELEMSELYEIAQIQLGELLTDEDFENFCEIQYAEIWTVIIEPEIDYEVITIL